MVAALLQAAVAAPVVEAAPNWGALGVGGALAGVMFYFYRQDRLSSEERWKKMSDDFRSIIEANTRAMTALEKAVETREEGHEARRAASA